MKNNEFINLYSNKLNNILQSAQNQELILKKNLKDGTLYIVNKEIFSSILLLSSEANNVKINNKRKPKENFYQIAKILNTISAYKYTIDTKEKYVTITDEEKIKERLSLKFSIWRNKQFSILEETITEKKLYGNSKKNLENEFKLNISSAEKKLNFILSHYDMFKSSLTSYKVLKPYEVVYFTTEDKKTHQEHLRMNVPNILYFEENQLLNSAKRSDKIVDKITSGGKHIFDDFYVEKKNEVYWKKLEQINLN